MESSQPAARPRPAWRRWLVWAVVLVVLVAAADLLGWDIRGWLSDLWHTVTSISLSSVVAACLLFGVQTTATAFAWYSILRFAYPARVRWRDILTGYAVAVALNCVLPANLGTAAMLLMFTGFIARATVAGVLGAFAVEKVFFTIAGAFVYLYLFLTVGGSFDREFSFVHDRPVATALLGAGSALLIAMLVRRLWPRVVRWWEQAKEGGAILARPGTYALRVFAPSLVAWLAMLAATGVLLAAYGIPVTFETLMRIVGGNSVANTVAVTPGGAGVTQAVNVASLRGIASPGDVTAYSVSTQLLGTAWNIAFALVLMVWAWGWTGGKALVSSSYEDAKHRQEVEREKRRERKAAPAPERVGG